MKSKFLYKSSLLFGLLLPLSTKLGNIALGCFLAVLLYYIISEKLKIQNSKPLVFSTIFLFLLLIMGFFISENLSEAANLFGRYVTYLLVPIFLIFLEKKDLIAIKENALTGLINGVFVASLFLLINNFVNYYSVKPLFTIDRDLLNYYHTYHYFTKPLKIYPTYFGFYLLLALFQVASSLFKAKGFKSRLIYAIMMLVYLLTVLFLNSRIVMGLTFVLSIYYGILFLKRLFSYNKSVFVLTFITVMLMVFFVVQSIQNTYLYSRFTQELSWDLTPNVNTAYNGKFADDSRITRWQSALTLVKNRPVFGYGSAMEKIKLKEAYLKNNLLASVQNGYDAHNQYLSIAIEFGLVGFTLLLFFLFSNLYFSHSSQQIVPFFFFIALISISLFENVFKNNAGIIFIAFFSNIFLFANYKK